MKQATGHFALTAQWKDIALAANTDNAHPDPISAYCPSSFVPSQLHTTCPPILHPALAGQEGIRGGSLVLAPEDRIRRSRRGEVRIQTRRKIELAYAEFFRAGFY